MLKALHYAKLCAIALRKIMRNFYEKIAIQITKLEVLALSSLLLLFRLRKKTPKQLTYLLATTVLVVEFVSAANHNIGLKLSVDLSTRRYGYK